MGLDMSENSSHTMVAVNMPTPLARRIKATCATEGKSIRQAMIDAASAWLREREADRESAA